METSTDFDEALAAALKLSIKERYELTEQIEASIERELDALVTGEHWGQDMNRLLDAIGPIELIYPEIEDATEWVKQIRRDEAKRRGLDWGEPE